MDMDVLLDGDAAGWGAGGGESSNDTVIDIWSWQDESGVFNPYDPATTLLLCAWQPGMAPVQVVGGRWEVDPSTMTQRNMQTGVQRVVAVAPATNTETVFNNVVATLEGLAGMVRGLFCRTVVCRFSLRLCSCVLSCYLSSLTPLLLLFLALALLLLLVALASCTRTPWAGRPPVFFKSAPPSAPLAHACGAARAPLALTMTCAIPLWAWRRRFARASRMPAKQLQVR